MDSPPYFLTHPTSRGSTITRRFTSKVLSLIEKYESLSDSNSANRVPLLHQPLRPAPISTFRRLGKSVLARARSFVENATGETKSNQKLEKIAPPKRRFLKLSSKHFKHYATENGSNGFDHDGTISSNGSIHDTDTSLTSTPPVARILPSSFFSQLTPSRKQKQTRGSFNPRGKWRNRKMTPPGSTDKHVRADIGPKESAFAEIKRKFVLPKISVRDLTERFQEAEKAKMCGEFDLKEEGRTFRVLPSGEIKPEEGERASRVLPHEELFLPEDSRDEDRSFGGLLDDIPGYYGSYVDSVYEDRDLKPTNESASALESTQLVCRDDMSYLNTDFKYMADGSLSNFGYFLYRLEAEAESAKPETEADTPNASTFFTAPTHMEYPEPKTMKVYRKTPPPSGFFLSPENRRIRDKTNAALKTREFCVVRYPGAMDIVSPTPMNAVQSAQLRGMVFRYT